MAVPALLVIGVLLTSVGPADDRDLGEVEVPPRAADVPTPPEVEPSESDQPVERRPWPTCTVGDDLTECVEWSRAVGAAQAATTGRVVVVNGRDALMGIDTATGATRWTVDVRPARLVTARDGVAVAAIETATIGIDSATGQIRWRIDGESAVPDGNPAAGAVITTGPVTETDQQMLRARAVATGELIVEGPTVPADARVATAGPLVLVHDAASRRLLAWDRAAAPRRVTWVADVAAPRVRPGSVLADQLLLFELWDVTGGTDAEPVLVALDRATGRERWRARVDGTGLDAADGVVVASAEGGIVGLDAVTGVVRWRRDDARLLSRDATGAGTVLLAVGSPPGQDLEVVDRHDGTLRWRQVFTGELQGAARADDRVLVWTRTRLVIVTTAEGTGIGTVEFAVTAAVTTHPPIVRTADRMHRVDLDVFVVDEAVSALP